MIMSCFLEEKNYEPWDSLVASMDAFWKGGEKWVFPCFRSILVEFA